MSEYLIVIALLMNGLVNSSALHFTMLEVAVDWHELPELAAHYSRHSRQFDLRCITTDIPPPRSAALGFHPVARIGYSLNDPLGMACSVGVGIHSSQRVRFNLNL